jgi:hypothetical protein
MSPNLTERRARVDARFPGVAGSGRRYPVEFDLRYKLLHGSQVTGRGLGRTREFCDGTVSFSVDRTLRPGADLELSLDWPLRIDGVCPLQLIVFGRVVRSREDSSTLKIMRYEFRTRSMHPVASRDVVSRSGFQIHIGSLAMRARRG